MVTPSASAISRAHVEGHPVAGVVVDDVQHTHGRGQQLGCLEHVIHWRSSEHVAGTGGVQHALADDHHVRGFVAGTGSLDDRHLVLVRRVRAHDQVVLRHVLQRVRVRRCDAVQHLGDELLGVVDELLHSNASG
jgi:hypothetical protein